MNRTIRNTSIDPTSSKTARITVSHSSPDTRLHGRWLVLVQIIWGALVILALVVSVASLPVSFAQTQTLCRPASCDPTSGQLTPEQAQAFHALGISLNTYAVISIAITIALALVWFAVAGVIAWRKSDDWMALLVALMLVLQGTNSVTVAVAGSHSIWQLPTLLFNQLAITIFILVFFLFPDGRFVPRWTRWCLVVWILGGALQKLFPGLPFAGLLNLLLEIGATTCVLLAQLYRYRRVSSPVQRQQTKWVVFGVSIALVDFLAVIIFNAYFAEPDLLTWIINTISMACISLLIPLSFGFSILRYRLYDIDILINRTLVYTTLTALLALLYFGFIFALQSLFQGMFKQNNAVAIVVSTLAIAALFQPLRHHIQKIIDRRFYRRKYDAAKTVAAFSATLRNEVDLNQLSEHLVAVVQETMQPTHVSLWLREPDSQVPRPDRMPPTRPSQ